RCLAHARSCFESGARRLFPEPDAADALRYRRRGRKERRVPELTLVSPVSAVEPVTEVLHGVSVTDPYRWLEDQDSPRTRQWIEEQRQFARACLDHLPGR